MSAPDHTHRHAFRPRCPSRPRRPRRPRRHACCSSHADAQPAPQKVKDPVCGMSVDPHTAKHRAEHAGRPYYFCSAGCRAKFLADPQRYLAPAEQPASRAARAGRDDLHLPDAPGGAAGRPGLVPDLRHGARAGDGDGRDRAQSRARRHAPPLLDRPGAGRAGRRARNGRPFPRARPSRRPAAPELGCSSCSRRRSSCGRAGRSSCAAGARSSRATSTCSR